MNIFKMIPVLAAMLLAYGAGAAPQQPSIVKKAAPAAVKAAREYAQDGDIVFFSPASASFDMYKNFEERGKHFKDLVNKL